MSFALDPPATASSSPWFPFSRIEQRGSRPRLYCLPYAGGVASAYHRWMGSLAIAEVVPVELPAHGARRREPGAESIAAIVLGLAEALEREEGPFALFGHSMGGLLAYELARLLAQRGDRRLTHLVVSAETPPEVPPTRPPNAKRTDAELTEELRELGGTPEEVLASPELMSLVLPLLRADLTLCEEHRHTPGPPLSIPLSVTGGVRDPLVSYSELQGWARHSSEFKGVRCLPGGHFYLQPYEPELMKVLTQILR